MDQGYTYKVDNKQNVESRERSLEKYVIWHIQGGLGKNVAATALIKDLKEKYPDRKLIMVVSWPEIFLNNPYIEPQREVVFQYLNRILFGHTLYKHR